MHAITVGHPHFTLLLIRSKKILQRVKKNVKTHNEVYIFKETANTQRVTLQCGSAVNYQNINRVKLLPGDNYNVVRHDRNGMQLDVSINGNNNNFYSPINPY